MTVVGPLDEKRGYTRVSIEIYSRERPVNFNDGGKIVKDFLFPLASAAKAICYWNTTKYERMKIKMRLYWWCMPFGSMHSEKCTAYIEIH